MKRILSTVLCVLLLLASLSACKPAETPQNPASPVPSPAETAAAGLYTPGKYTGEGTGFGGKIIMEVEVDANKILSVTPVEHSETAVISDPAFAKIPAEILATQSVAVDTVSGCTLASNGIIEAVKAALLQSGVSETEIMTPKGGESSTKTGDLNYEADVVIVGSGGAGLSAAVEALNAGASVIVIDKQPSYGGNTIMAGSALNTSNPATQKLLTMAATEKETVESFLAMEPKDELMKKWQDTAREEWEKYKAEGAAYLFDSPSFHKLQTYVDGNFVAKPELIDIFGDNSLSALNFLTDLGTEWQEVVSAAIGATWRRSHTPTLKYGVRGAAFTTPQYDKAVAGGAQILLDMKAEEIVMTDGRATGITGFTTTDKRPFEIKAKKGVIIATGGFGANVEMRQRYNKHWDTLDESVPTTNGPQATGDGIVMAEKVGANLIGMEWIQLVPTIGPGMITTYIENMIIVKEDGTRFIKEDGRRDELSEAFLDQGRNDGTKGGIVTALWDSNTVVDGKTIVGVDVEARVADGRLVKADTIEELAKKLNMDPTVLKKTVDDFNNYVKNGNDPLGRKVFDQAFAKPPYYAGDVYPCIHHTMGGIEINGSTEVLDKEGKVITGLYACGETTGGIHGANRLGGNAITDIIVFGRIAGQNAAK